MAFWDRLLRSNRKGASNREAPPKTEKTQADRMNENQIVEQVVETLMSRQTAMEKGTFETAGKGIESIICSDNECPCTDQKQLKLGQDAYLYISPGVVDYRKDCLTV